jgi:hypothetical protein
VPATERKLKKDVALSGATLVRLKVWPKYVRPYVRPPVELVVATATPATFLKAHFRELYFAICGGPFPSGAGCEFTRDHTTFLYVEVVNPHGTKILESAVPPPPYPPTEYIQPRFRNCMGTNYSGSTSPCPTR